MNSAEAKKTFSAEVKKIIAAYYPHLNRICALDDGRVDIPYSGKIYTVALVITLGTTEQPVTTIRLFCHHQIAVILRDHLPQLQSLAVGPVVEVAEIANAQPKFLPFLSS